eukprot:CAMPEP_0172877128 /NCGR_PEP_ID=MMETSP1075-20121228/106197_1 /TAXON_ID=2916 /ORGANISM="Ceratium fusus, Strain PA161109" /LENGTH=99 /DNA_ID=CAMNT_0013728619 /DNA_START=173 /DNA_END=472 /DNA_ORIENTATION=-
MPRSSAAAATGGIGVPREGTSMLAAPNPFVAAPNRAAGPRPPSPKIFDKFDQPGGHPDPNSPPHPPAFPVNPCAALPENNHGDAILPTVARSICAARRS